MWGRGVPVFGVHRRTQCRIVDSWGMLLWVLTLMRVKNMVKLRAWSVWVTRCIILLCLEVQRPLRCWFSHVDRRWGYEASLCISIIIGAWCTIGVRI